MDTPSRSAPVSPPTSAEPPTDQATETETIAAEPVCAACDTPLGGEYCSACGHRRQRPEDESLGHFLREGLSVLTSADSALWRSIRGLFVPGKLTAEHFAGRRGLYLHPVRIFVVLNIVFFFALSNAGGSMFRGPLDSHTGAGWYGDVATRISTDQAERWESPEAYEAAFDQQADTLAPSIIGLLVPILALVLGLVLWPAGKASGVRHLVFATHSVAAIMVTLLTLLFGISLILIAMALIGYSEGLTTGIDPIAVPLAVVAIVAYFILGIRRAYGVPWWGATVSGLLVSVVGLQVALILFRVALFFMTVWTLDAPAA